MKTYKNTDVLAEKWHKNLTMAEFKAHDNPLFEGQAMTLAGVLSDLENAPTVDEETIYRRVKRRYLKEDIKMLLSDEFGVDDPSEDMLRELADNSENAMEWGLPARDVIYNVIEHYLDEHQV